MSLSSRRPVRATAAALAALAAAGCSSVTDNVDTSPKTRVRFVQAVSDATGGVDLAVNGSTQLAGLPFGAVTTQGGYARLPVAPQITFTTTGASSAFFSRTLSELVADRYFTIVVLGQTGSGSAPAATAAVLADTTAASASGALFRVFNAVDYLPNTAGGDPVDVYIYAQGTARPATPDVAGLAWNARTAYLLKSAGAVQVDVFPAGAASTGTPTLSTAFTVAAGVALTCILRDAPASAAADVAGAVVVLRDYP